MSYSRKIPKSYSLEPQLTKNTKQYISEAVVQHILIYIELKAGWYMKEINNKILVTETNELSRTQYI